MMAGWKFTRYHPSKRDKRARFIGITGTLFFLFEAGNFYLSGRAFLRRGQSSRMALIKVFAERVENGFSEPPLRATPHKRLLNGFGARVLKQKPLSCHQPAPRFLTPLISVWPVQGLSFIAKFGAIAHEKCSSREWFQEHQTCARGT